jgi:D-aminopeptidase
VAGIPIGRDWPDDAPFTRRAASQRTRFDHRRRRDRRAPAADATQAHRAARGDGVARTGGTAGNGSGDIFLAFSTANSAAATTVEGLQQATFVPNDRLDGLFEATVLATEEAIVNAMVAARTMTGIDGNRLVAIDHARLQEMLRATRGWSTDEPDAR